MGPPNIASIAIVTIAIIFAGYQVAFNHKRLGDVAPVLIGETITAIATVSEIDEKRRRVTLRTQCLNGDKVVLDGEAVVLVPRRDAH